MSANPKIYEEAAKAGVQFTSENQPSPEAKSLGHKKKWEYRKLRQQFLEELIDIQLADGTKANFWEECCKIIRKEILDKNSKLKPDKKLKLIKEFMELSPKDDNLNLNTNINAISIKYKKSNKVDESDKKLKNNQNIDSDNKSDCCPDIETQKKQESES